jgi:para-nitrobenzyl esterase
MSSDTPNTMAEPVVETLYGKVRGTTKESIYCFKGIRYGSTTGGENRFMPPRKPEPWKGVMDAFEFGKSTPQTNPKAGQDPLAGSILASFFAGAGGRELPPESEDCLFLNVWTQGLSDGKKRPVMFWLHGGGFTAGSASTPLYDGKRLAQRGDVVVVTINHRLNVFGFSHFGDLGGSEYAHSGNLGMLDAIAALEWVRDNIEGFGGDPDRVMIFGESGGGQKVSMLMASPPAQGLFHGGVIQSGPGVKMLDRDQGTKVSELLLSELGLNRTRLNDIRTLPVEDLLNVYYQVLPKIGMGLPGFINSFAPVIDPVVLPAHPFSPAASAISRDVPLMVGCNRTEMTLFMFADAEAFALDEAGMRKRVSRMLRDDTDRVIDVYKKAYPNYSPTDLYVRIWTDYPTTLFSINIAERKAALKGAPAYLYRFDWETPIMGGKLRSPHALEIPFVFDNINFAKAFTGGGEDAVLLAAKMSEAWIAFAATGDPNTSKSGLPPWTPYDGDKRSTMLFGNESRCVEDPQQAERVVLDGILNPE